MYDDRWERARENHIRWQNEDWDRQYRERRAAEDSAAAHEAFRRGDLAWAAMKMGMTDVAVDIARGERFSTAPELPRDPMAERLERAEKLLDEREYFRAQLELAFPASEDCPNPRVHFLLGVSLFQQDEHARALTAFRAAVRHGAPIAPVAVWGARCLLTLAQYAEAERWLSDALADGRGGGELVAELHFLRGRAHAEQDNPAGAVADFKRAVAGAPKRGVYWVLLGQAHLDTREPDAALVSFDRAEALGVAPATLDFDRALAHFDQRDLAAAERHVNRVIAAQPDRTSAYTLHGLISRRQRHFAAAVADYSRCVELQPKRMSHWIDRGICFLETNNLGEALADFVQAEQLGPKSPQPPFYRCECLLRMGRVREAQEAIARALELGPGYEPALRLRERCWKA